MTIAPRTALRRAALTAAAVGLPLALYVGVALGRSHARADGMRDAMEAQAGLAAKLSDRDIRERLRTAASELGLPAAAHQIAIQRRGRPREIVVSTSWADTIALPFFRLPVPHRPVVRAPL